MLSQQTLQRLNYLLKTGIAFLCLGYLYHTLFVRQKLEIVWEQFSKVEYSTVKFILLFATLVLVLVNWGLEAGKWKLLINRIEDVHWLKAFKAVLSGISISIFTPNRIGEFAARIFYLESNHRIKGILISIIGSISQLCVALVAGSFCLSYFLIQHRHIDGIELKLLCIFPFVLSGISVLFYFNMDVLRSLLLKINRGRRTRFYLNVFKLYSERELFKVLLFSMLRFMVFNLQYYFLFLFYDIHIPILESLLVSSCIFFVLAVIPTMALTELGIRGVAAIYFLDTYSSDELGILAASYSLWCINLALPAITGLLFLPQLKFFRK